MPEEEERKGEKKEKKASVPLLGNVLLKKLMFYFSFGN